MSKKAYIEWHTPILAASAILALIFFLYMVKPVMDAAFQGNLPVYQMDETPTIREAFFDEQCALHIIHSDGYTRMIQTDHKLANREAQCAADAWVRISPDNRYVAFEGSNWHSPDEKGYNPGNYIGVYFATHNKLAQLNFGSAIIDPVNFENEDIMTYLMMYEGESIQLKKAISLSYIEDHFEETVDPATKKIRLIPGVEQ